MMFISIHRIHTVIFAFFVLRASAFVSFIHRKDLGDLSGASKACQLLNQSFPQLVSFPGRHILRLWCVGGVIDEEFPWRWITGAEQYTNDTEHFYVSSGQNSTCSIEPTNTKDVSSIIEIIGRPDIRAPFAVKAGGHAYNLGQSSTPGVQISMARFTNISYDAEQATVSIGMGLTWDEVYAYLEPLGVMVAGGRIDGVGVGGYSLGGGYSWKTDQFGLLIDTIVSHELVLPSGELVHVTNASEPDLFFALKGGLNNFGIVTGITLEAHNQTLVFGGSLTHSMNTIESLNTAISDFSQNNTDTKAQLVTVYSSNNNQFMAQILLFYDAPTPPAGVYDAILSIPTVTKDVKTQSFVDFMSTFGTTDPGIGPFGAAQHVVPIVRYTKPLLDEMVAQVNAFGARLTAQNNGSIVVVSINAEPLLNPFSHSRGGAYPHPPSREVTPASPSVAYQEDLETPLAGRIARQAEAMEEVKNFSRIIQAKAVEEGVSRWDDILYPNYALIDTPLELLYGSNLQRLRTLAAKYDPDRVMTLTGGFRFQTQVN